MCDRTESTISVIGLRKAPHVKSSLSNAIYVTYANKGRDDACISIAINRLAIQHAAHLVSPPPSIYIVVASYLIIGPVDMRMIRGPVKAGAKASQLISQGMSALVDNRITRNVSVRSKSAARSGAALGHHPQLNTRLHLE